MGSTLLRKLVARFLQTPVGELRATKFHRIASNMRDDQTVQTKVGYSDESNSHHTRDTAFSRWGRGSGMAGITTARGLALLSPRACSAQDWLLALTGLNPAASTLVAENVTFCAKKPLYLRSPSLLIHSWIRPTSPRNWADSCVK